MVMGNHSWEEQTRRLLSEAQSELRELQTKIDEMQDRAANLVAEIGGYEIALRGYLSRTGRQEVAKIEWNKLLSGQTHKEKLKTIAKQNAGRIRVSQATDILYTGRFTEAKKRATAYSMVQVYLADMTEDGIFEKVGAGEFRLIASQPSLPGVTSR